MSEVLEAIASDKPETAAPAVGVESPEGPRRLHHESWITSVQSLAVTVVIAIFVIAFIVQAFQIPSESMENTLLVGDYLLVDKTRFADPGPWQWLLPYERITRGDIVVFRYPVKAEEHFVKRVVARPGDRLRIANGILYVNNEAAIEAYALFKPKPQDGYRDNFPTTQYTSQQLTAEWRDEFPGFVRGKDLLVPAGHYFVLGDNRNESLDSRYWGFVAQENIVGKPMLIYLSFAHAPSAPAPQADGRIDGFAARIWRLPIAIRWERTFRFVR